METILQTQNLVQQYSSSVEIKFPDITIQKGEKWLLLGQSGSGKTTLLHILGGIRRATSGKAELLGRDLSKLSGAELDKFRGRNTGIIFQQLHLVASLTVSQNVMLARYFAGYEQDKDALRKVLKMLGILELENRYPSALSVGQQQRVAIARALINQPKLLLADEPTAALDDHNCQQVIRELLTIADENDAALLVATHDNRIKNMFDHKIELKTL